MNPLPFVVSNTSLGEVFGAVLQLHCWDCYRGAVNLAIGPVLPVSHRQSLLRQIHCVHRRLEPFSLASSSNNTVKINVNTQKFPKSRREHFLGHRVLTLNGPICGAGGAPWRHTRVAETNAAE